MAIVQGMATKLIDTLLLLALPASGKSEVRRYLAHLSDTECREDFRLGPTVQLDDYPYVHMMRRVSQALRELSQDPIFFVSDEHSMNEPRDWGMLIELLNLDYDDLVNRRRHTPASCGAWLLDRYDTARQAVGVAPVFGGLPKAVREGLVAAIEEESNDLLKEKNAGIPSDLQGKTLVIEFARGGPDGAKLPLPPPWGYAYSLSRLHPAILEKASILYVWVTPEESRRKNYERADPNNPGSILHHGVPLTVMLGDYGCDDMEWLMANSEKPGTVSVTARGQKYHLPFARFDNRQDKTTFVRVDREKWHPNDVNSLHQGLSQAFQQLAK